LKDGFLGLRGPLLHVLEEDMLRVVRSSWKYSELELPGYQILYSGRSDAPIWGANTENFGHLAVIEVSIDGLEESFGFEPYDDETMELYFSEGVDLAYLLTILTVADFSSERKLNKVAFYDERVFGGLTKPVWVPPRFVYLRFFATHEESELQTSYLFDTEAHPDFEDSWLDDPMSLLDELESQAEEFDKKSQGLFDSEGVYKGERVQPLWLAEFKPNN